MDPADIRAFVARARAPVERAKLAYWATKTQTNEHSALLAGWALHAHARRASPEFPSAAYSADDFEHHLRLKQLLDRASHALSIHRAPR